MSFSKTENVVEKQSIYRGRNIVRHIITFLFVIYQISICYFKLHPALIGCGFFLPFYSMLCDSAKCRSPPPVLHFLKFQKKEEKPMTRAYRIPDYRKMYRKRLIFQRRDNAIILLHNGSQDMLASCPISIARMKRCKHFTILWRIDNASKNCHR